MNLDQLFERAIVMTKLVWRKRGNDLSRHEVQRMVATGSDARPEAKVEETNA